MRVHLWAALVLATSSACAPNPTGIVRPLPANDPKAPAGQPYASATTSQRTTSPSTAEREPMNEPEPWLVEAASPEARCVNIHAQRDAEAIIQSLAEGPVLERGNWFACPVVPWTSARPAWIVGYADGDEYIPVEVTGSPDLEARDTDFDVERFRFEASAWRSSSETDPMTDTTNVHFYLSSDNSINLGFGQSIRPTLTIGCYSNNTQIYIAHRDRFIGRGEMRTLVRVDDNAAQTLAWSVGTSGETVGSFRGSTSIPFLLSLSGHDQLVFRYTPFSESQWTVRFSIDGIDTAIGDVRSACSW